MEWRVIILLKFLAFEELTILLQSYQEEIFQVQVSETIIKLLMVHTNYETSFPYITVWTTPKNRV
jgi:hypothetical protein